MSMSDLEGNDLGLESFVKLPQSLLFADGVLSVESSLLLITV